MQRMRIAILRGGHGDEYAISLETGASIMRALSDTHDIIDVVITKAGDWLVRGFVKAPKEILHNVDAVFVALHGTREEDGSIQRLLESYGVPYTGSGAFPSRLASHKAMTKDRMHRHGVRMPRHMLIGQDALQNMVGTVVSIEALFGPRYIIKPVAGGSSVGAMYAESTLILERALRTALSVYTEVLVEEYIEGKEATCGVIEKFRGQDLYALPSVEIERTSPILTHAEKRNPETPKICPTCFSTIDKKEIERIALLAHTELGLSHYSRSDFIVASDGVYFLEINAHPDLSEYSAIQKALEAVGTTYAEFIRHVLALTGNRRLL